MKDKKELTRIPKSISNNHKIMQRTFGCLSGIVTDIMIFLGDRQFGDIFGNIEFTLDDFCKKMGANKTNLQRKLSVEEKLEIFGKNGVPVYHNPTGEQMIENYFESALWIATERNLMMESSNGKGGTTFTGVQIVNKFDIGADLSSKKKVKKTYLVSFSNTIKDLLFTNYNLIELKDYRLIPYERGYRDFYLFLARIIVIVRYKQDKQGEAPCFILSVDEVANIFGLQEYAETREKKRAITRILNKIQKTIQHTNFSYQYVKNGHKHAYHILFDFKQETLDYFDEKLKATFFQSLLNAFEQDFSASYFGHLSMYDRIKAMNNLHLTLANNEQDSRKVFIDWMYDTDALDKRLDTFNKVFLKVWGIPYSKELNIEFA